MGITNAPIAAPASAPTPTPVPVPAPTSASGGTVMISSPQITPIYIPIDVVTLTSILIRAMGASLVTLIIKGHSEALEEGMEPGAFPFHGGRPVVELEKRVHGIVYRPAFLRSNLRSPGEEGWLAGEEKGLVPQLVKREAPNRALGHLEHMTDIGHAWPKRESLPTYAPCRAPLGSQLLCVPS